MNRRQFLRVFGSGAAAAPFIDLDRLLWVPGAKTWFLPTPPETGFYLADATGGVYRKGAAISERTYRALLGNEPVWKLTGSLYQVDFPTVRMSYHERDNLLWVRPEGLGLQKQFATAPRQPAYRRVGVTQEQARLAWLEREAFRLEEFE